MWTGASDGRYPAESAAKNIRLKTPVFRRIVAPLLEIDTIWRKGRGVKFGGKLHRFLPRGKMKLSGFSFVICSTCNQLL